MLTVGNGKAALPKVPSMEQYTFPDSLSYLGGRSSNGSDKLHNPETNTGSHSGSIAVTPKKKK